MYVILNLFSASVASVASVDSPRRADSPEENRISFFHRDEIKLSNAHVDTSVISFS